MHWYTVRDLPIVSLTRSLGALKQKFASVFPKLPTGRSLLAIYDGGRAAWWAGRRWRFTGIGTFCAPAGALLTTGWKGLDVNIQRGCVMWSHYHHNLKSDNDKNSVLSFYILEWTALTQWTCPSLLADLIIPKFSLLLVMRILIFLLI